MQLGTKLHFRFCWPSLNHQRMANITFVLRRIALRSKFLSLNQQYQVRIHSLKHKGKASSLQDAQETYWYETACLMEESRKLKLRFPNIVTPQLSLTNISSKVLQAQERESLYAQIQKTTANHPPSMMTILLLSLLHGISIGIGIFWLIAPR